MNPQSTLEGTKHHESSDHSYTTNTLDADEQNVSGPMICSHALKHITERSSLTTDPTWKRFALRRRVPHPFFSDPLLLPTVWPVHSSPLLS